MIFYTCIKSHAPTIIENQNNVKQISQLFEWEGSITNEIVKNQLSQVFSRIFCWVIQGSFNNAGGALIMQGVGVRSQNCCKSFVQLMTQNLRVVVQQGQVDKVVLINVVITVKLTVLIGVSNIVIKVVTGKGYKHGLITVL